MWISQVKAIFAVYLQYFKSNWVYVLLLLIAPSISVLVSKTGYYSGQIPPMTSLGNIPLNLFLGAFPLLILALDMLATLKESKRYSLFRRLGLIDSAFWFTTLFILMVFIFVCTATFTISIVWIIEDLTVPWMVLCMLQFALCFGLVSTGLLFGSMVSNDIVVGALWMMELFFNTAETPMTYLPEGMPLIAFSARIFPLVRYLYLFFFPGPEYGKCWGDIFAHVVPMFANNNTTTPVTLESIFLNSYARYNQTAILFPDRYASLPSLFGSWSLMIAFGILKVLLAMYLMQTPLGSSDYSQSFSYMLKSSYWFPKRTVETSVCVQDLKKMYDRDGTAALDGISYEFKKGNVYVLLGSNGAGKSTLCGIITGLISATSGAASILGYSLDQVHFARRNLGVCNQHCTLMQDLTALQHIQYYISFRGVKLESKSVVEFAVELLKKVNLEKHLNQKVNEFSGGSTYFI
jgi:ABC-type multidrug transport system fused ATPase/permease subunit